MNKFTAAASVALALVAGSAFAADLPSRKESPVYVPPPPSFSWNGLYGGVNIGYGFGDGSQETGGLGYVNALPRVGAPSGSGWGVSQNLNGVLGGGQAGYNWQFSPWLVIGLEADMQAADVHDTVNAAVGLLDPAPFGSHVASATSTKSVDWYGTVRGRIGVAPFAPNLLIYGTGGLAYGQVVQTVSFTDNFASGGYNVARGNYDGTSVGWAAGGGIEWAPLQFPAFSVKLEYLYVDLGNTTVSGSTIASTGGLAFAASQNSPTRFHTVRAGLNWHFNPFAPAPIVAKY